MKFSKLAIVFLTVVFSVAAQTTDLTGKWKAIWLISGVANGKPNAITLAESDGVLTGNYTADDGKACSVKGNHTDKVRLHVYCAEWDIVMEGVLASDNQTISGNYTAYGNARGQFVMDKLKN